MDYISGFGIKCAALTLGLAASSIAIASPNLAALVQSSDSIQSDDSVKKASITVNVSGLKNEKGDVLICLSKNKKEFPDCRKDKTSRQKKVSAANSNKIIFENVEPGTYALALVHDKNSNGKMDLALFLPKEGFGMSNNPKVRMGKPKFKNSQFIVDNIDIVHDIKMKYIL